MKIQSLIKKKEEISSKLKNIQEKINMITWKDLEKEYCNRCFILCDDDFYKEKSLVYFKKELNDKEQVGDFIYLNGIFYKNKKELSNNNFKFFSLEVGILRQYDIINKCKPENEISITEFKKTVEMGFDYSIEEIFKK